MNLPCPDPEGCKHFKDATKQINYKESMRLYWEEAHYNIDAECTCNDCSDKDNCGYAFDLYNINDECLASK